MSQRHDKNARRRMARKFRIRKKLMGTSARPRVSIYLSNRNVIAQMIDDQKQVTIASASTLDKGSDVKGKTKADARAIGSRLAERAAALGVTDAIFDRNGYRYHGRVKELADSLREKGLLK